MSRMHNHLIVKFEILYILIANLLPLLLMRSIGTLFMKIELCEISSSHHRYKANDLYKTIYMLQTFYLAIEMIRFMIYFVLFVSFMSSIEDGIEEIKLISLLSVLNMESWFCSNEALEQYGKDVHDLSYLKNHLLQRFHNEQE